MRIELECLSVSWIQLPLSYSSIDELYKTYEDHSKAIDNLRYRDIFRLNEIFHQQINQHCGNTYLEEMINNMSDKGLLAR